MNNKINGESPERDGCKTLVEPAKILPENAESIGIVYLPSEQREGAEEQWHSDDESALYGALLHLDEIGNDESS